MFHKIIPFFFFIFLTLSNVLGQKSGIPEAPNPQRLVNNLSKAYPDFLTSDEEQILEQKLERFAKETSNQIVIVIVDDLKGYEPAEFAYELGDKWQVGHEKEDNGIVILIKPTGGKGQRKFFIATGKGLEGAIPDATCREIENNELVPNLANGDFYKALDQTTDVLMKLAKGEYNSKEYSKENNEISIQKVILVIIIIIVVIIVMFNNKGGGRGGYTMGSGGIFFGGFGGGGFGGGSSSGGGGFGGFGGGSFGGGGSGGSW
ncbi:MAG: TPM domain-containing protein [Flavobacteriia bacterium]|nr:TPM domain-containing protein [Flavobacteriia bacterium]